MKFFYVIMNGGHLFVVRPGLKYGKKRGAGGKR